MKPKVMHTNPLYTYTEAIKTPINNETVVVVEVLVG